MNISQGKARPTYTAYTDTDQGLKWSLNSLHLPAVMQTAEVISIISFCVDFQDSFSNNRLLTVSAKQQCEALN